MRMATESNKTKKKEEDRQAGWYFITSINELENLSMLERVSF